MTAIGTTARMRLLACCVLVTVLALVTAGCGGSGSGSSGTAASSSGATESAPGNPPTESSGTESPRPTESGVSVSLPSLPIGGSPDGTSPQQCVQVSWTGDQIIEGATVVVTRIDISPSGVFTVDTSGRCGSPDCAASFSFQPSQTSCTVAVLATGATGATAALGLSGSARCALAAQQWCRNLNVSGATIQLTQPSQAAPSS